MTRTPTPARGGRSERRPPVAAIPTLALAALAALACAAPDGPAANAGPEPSTPTVEGTAAPQGSPAPGRGVMVTVPADSPAAARHAMVVSAHRLASEVGDRVLRDGGNAVDAAVATGLALAVVYPRAGNIGGGGFMVLRFPDGRTTAIDFREKAPLAAHPEMWLDSAGEYDRGRHHLSHKAVGVPGTVAGLAYAHERYGLLPWARLVEPAVRLAR
ncbi:MAG: gamma-glutamyltransferase, partial [Longimicrobiales bacterium]|nr:gamma-glutamyltransferase [Longimicrobiales bacterium]